MVTAPISRLDHTLDFMNNQPLNSPERQSSRKTQQHNQKFIATDRSSQVTTSIHQRQSLDGN